MAASPFRDELIATAKQLCAPGKGFLAADESTNTIGQRFTKIGVENTLENRRAYRELLFATAGPWENFISGVIMYEETLTQTTHDGVLFTELLRKRGVHVGIKTDKGVVPLMGTDGETATQGIDGYTERAKKYYEQGARFCKWRNVIKISEHCPSELAIQDCANTLARYASLSQANGLVPIVEPEVLMDGAHSIERCAAVTERVWVAVFRALHEHNVLLEGIVLKPNMVTSGAQSGKTDTPEDIAFYTVRTLRRTVPPAVPGIFFLSGGQNEEEATLNLNAMNVQNPALGSRPWHISFSYGRALQASTLAAWRGKPENVAEAQKVYFVRAEANSLANLGKYGGSAGSDAARASLYEKDYKY